MAVPSLLKNRNFLGLLAANAIFGSAFPIQLILGGLVGVMLAPTPSMATLPPAIQTLAALCAAAPFSLLMGRFGRRVGFALGALLTLLGGVAAIVALVSQSFVMLCAAHFAMGAGWAAFQFFRFAAGEVVAEQQRPVAISFMLSALLVAALVGPQAFIVAKDALAPLPFAGAYLATCGLAVLGLVPLLAVNMSRPVTSVNARPSPRLFKLVALKRPPVRRAIGIAALSQGVMVFLMIPTPIAIVACGFSEATASDVIRWHIVAMFAPSFLTGFLIQRWGAMPIALSGLALIIMAAGVAALGLTAGHFYGALIVLGLGWNFSFIGATTLLANEVPDAERAAVQGFNDTAIAFVSTLCAFAAGFVLAHLGWAVLALISLGGILTALMGLVLVRPAPSQS